MSHPHEERRLTVAKLRKALASLPDDMPVTVELGCTEGCGVGSEGAESVRVESCPSDDVRHYDEEKDVTTYTHVKSVFISAERMAP